MTGSSHFLRRASHWLWACVFWFGAGCGDGAGPPAVSAGPSPIQHADKVEANEKEPPRQTDSSSGRRLTRMKGRSVGNPQWRERAVSV